jgi:hypothetical protein
MANINTELSIDHLIRRAESIATLLEAARSAVQEATELVEALHPAMEGIGGARREWFPRFDHEVVVCFRGLASDLGIETDNGRGDFDIDRTPNDARNLCDLIAFASTSREEMAA